MRWQLRPVLLAGTLAAGAALSPPAYGQGGVALEALFADIAADKAQAEALVPAWFGPVDANRVGVYASLIIQLLRNPTFVTYVLDAAGPPGADTAVYLGGPVYAATQAAVDAGVPRLPLDDEAAYLATGTAFAAWVAEAHPDACRVVMSANDPGDERTLALQAEYQNTLPPDALFAYLDLGYRAILAEINDTPAATAFTPAELERGYDAYAAALEAAVVARPNAAALVAAANLEPAAADADICEVMVLTLTIVGELQQPERDWAVHFILTQQ